MKRKRAPAAHLDASPDDPGKDQPKKKANTAVNASAEFKPPSRSGAQPSRGTVASPSGRITWQETWVPDWLRLQDRRRSKSPLYRVFCLFLQSCVREASRTRLRRECTYMPLRACTFLPSFYFSACTVCILCPVFVVFRHNCFRDLECARPRALRDIKKQFILQDKLRHNWRPAECHFRK